MLMINSLNSYTKSLKMQMQLDMKQAAGELGSKKTIQDYLGGTDGSKDDEEKSRDKLRAIHQKIFSGAKLTAEERKYLQSKDPEAYSKLQQNEQDQRAFEARLRQCRTKEEAQRLRFAYLGTSLAKLKAVEHNSNIPAEKKLEIFAQEKQRCDMIDKSSREFVRRGDYNALPTEAEAAKARKDAAEKAKPAKKPKKDRLEKDSKKPEKSGRYEPKERKVHAETAEERKVKRAKARARANAVSDYGKAVAAYIAAAREASSGAEEAAIVSKAEASIDVKG